MFRERYQKKLFSLLSCVGSQPLFGWIVQEGSGTIRQVKDEGLKSYVLELLGANVATTYIASPPPIYHSLGLSLPCVTLFIYYLNQPFSFEIQILDNDDIKRRFRFSSYHSETKVSMFVTTKPLQLTSGWNIVQLNLAEFTEKAYRTMYMETLTVQVHANCRLRKIYFSDRLYTDEELPAEYKLLSDKKVVKK